MYWCQQNDGSKFILFFHRNKSIYITGKRQIIASHLNIHIITHLRCSHSLHTSYSSVLAQYSSWILFRLWIYDKITVFSDTRGGIKPNP